MSEKQCVRCGRAGHDSDECKWLSVGEVNKQLLDALKESIRLSAELMISAVGIKPTEAGIDRVIGISKEGSAIHRFMKVIAAAEQAQQAEPPAVAVPDGLRILIEQAADKLEGSDYGLAHDLRAMLAAAPQAAVAVPDECVAVASALTSQYLLRNSGGTLYCMHCLHDCENRESHDKGCPVLQARAIVNDNMIAAAQKGNQ